MKKDLADISQRKCEYKYNNNEYNKEKNKNIKNDKNDENNESDSESSDEHEDEGEHQRYRYLKVKEIEDEERKNRYMMNSALDPSYLPRPLNMIPLSYDAVRMRDRAVVDDPLYPPLNRNSLSPHDSYRMVGYLVGEESKDDVWQLFGRQVNNTRSQFYVRPTDRNIDMKIPLQDEDFRNPRFRLRDIDNLPEVTSIDNPIFTSSSYRIFSNPNSDFNSLYL